MLVLLSIQGDLSQIGNLLSVDWGSCVLKFGLKQGYSCKFCSSTNTNPALARLNLPF